MTTIHIGAYRFADGTEELFIADSAQNLLLAAIGCATFCNTSVSGSLFSHSYLLSEINERLEPNGGLRLFSGIEDAVKYGESISDGVSLIKHLSNPEDACKQYLESKDYFVSADRESAIEELSGETMIYSAGPSTTHDQYAADVLEKTAELARKHGWLKVLETLETL